MKTQEYINLRNYSILRTVKASLFDVTVEKKDERKFRLANRILSGLLQKAEDAIEILDTEDTPE